MELRQLEYFVAAVEHGSISRAAARLNLAQPTLSRQILVLEKALGQRLIERTGRGVKPTQAGKTLLAHARIMLNSASQALADLKELHAEPVGNVVVGMPNHVAARIAGPLVESFRERLPRALLTITEGLTLSLRDSLSEGRIDLALMFDPAPTPLLMFEPLRREAMMLVAPEHFDLPEKVPLSSLADFPMVLPGTHNPIRTVMHSALIPHDIQLNVVAETGAVLTALAVVEHGLACSVLPEGIQHLHPNNKVQWRKIGPPTIQNQLVLAMARARPISRLTLETARILRDINTSCVLCS